MCENRDVSGPIREICVTSFKWKIPAFEQAVDISPRQNVVCIGFPLTERSFYLVW
jgi:hypothetical protein